MVRGCVWIDAVGMTSILVRTGREAAYLTAGLVTSVIAFAVWIAAVTVSVSLAVFIVGLPCMIVSAIVFRWVSELDRRNASWLVGRPIRGRYQDHRAETLFGRLRATWRDPQTWRDFSWLSIHSVLGFAFGVAALTLVACVVGAATLPLWFWSIPDGVQYGLWTVHSFPVAVATAFLAIPCAAATIVLLRWMAWTEALLAASLLGPRRVRTAS
jgi:hypothetical protein